MAGLDETTFFETETRPRPGLVKISRLRRDQDQAWSKFRDQDETENSVKGFFETETRPRREILHFLAFRDRDETFLKHFKLVVTPHQVTPPFS